MEQNTHKSKESLANCDFYHLLMAQGFFKNNYQETQVCFEFFFRELPFANSYAIFAGLGSFLLELKNFSFSNIVLNFLRAKQIFSEEFLEFLASWKFRGNIFAPEEGEIIFPLTPIMRIEGNILECHLLETLVLNILNYQSLIATKTSRIACIAENIPFVEMGLRRAYGPDGAFSATRAAFIGGAFGTSNTLAASHLNIPIIGSMSHSWVMSHTSELDAFLEFGRVYPLNQTFLLDTYNTLKSGLPNAIKAFLQLKEELGYFENALYAIRIDSGDLDYLSKKVRKELDQAGLKHVKILVSDNIDEKVLFQLKQLKTPIDIIGIGTHLVSRFSSDFSGVYKMVAFWNNEAWVPKIKISESGHKTTIAGVKNIIRFYNSQDIALMDYVFLEEEYEDLVKHIQNKEKIEVYFPFTPYKKKVIKNYSYFKKIMNPIVQKGDSILKEKGLGEIQVFVKQNLATLHQTHKRLINPHLYNVGYSYKLAFMTWEAMAQHSYD